MMLLTNINCSVQHTSYFTLISITTVSGIYTIILFDMQMIKLYFIKSSKFPNNKIIERQKNIRIFFSSKIWIQGPAQWHRW